ncbi:Dna2/Cas4 domain-containing protein [Finegoldia magna]|nr:Dna2/Cas4 domain-containing protein [Finegoldia magna]
MIYYYFVCKRKLWYYCQNISVESDLFKLKKKIQREIDEKID